RAGPGLWCDRRRVPHRLCRDAGNLQLVGAAEAVPGGTAVRHSAGPRDRADRVQADRRLRDPRDCPTLAADGYLQGRLDMIQRTVILFGALFAFFVVLGFVLGQANITLLLVQAFAHALIALGLNIQWGYGGLFNFGIMGFLMLGGAAVT